MAISFGGATSWNGASESLRSLRTKEKAADKSPFTPDTPPPVKPQEDDSDRYGIKPFTPTYDGWMGGLFRNIIGSIANQFQQNYAPILQQSNDQFADPSTRVNPLPKFLSDMDARTKTAQQEALNRKINPNLSALLGHDRYTNPDPNRLIWNQAAELSKNMFPMPDPDSAYMDSAQWLKDKNAGLSAPTATKPSTAPTTTQALPEGFEQYDKGYVEQQPWYEGGDIGVFGGPVQPTEWTDPETGRKYRVEVSARGFGWYPVGFGKLDSPAPPDEDTGGYDWWNYSGWGGGGGGGGYYSAPSTYSNSNWIDRILTNWRINRK